MSRIFVLVARGTPNVSFLCDSVRIVLKPSSSLSPCAIYLIHSFFALHKMGQVRHCFRPMLEVDLNYLQNRMRNSEYVDIRSGRLRGDEFSEIRRRRTYQLFLRRETHRQTWITNQKWRERIFPRKHKQFSRREVVFFKTEVWWRVAYVQPSPCKLVTARDEDPRARGRKAATWSP